MGLPSINGNSAGAGASPINEPSKDPKAPPQPTTTNPSQSTSMTPPTLADPSTLPPAALDLAAKLFDLARAGTTPLLLTYLDAGIPANLTNASGDTLLMLAAYHGHADAVRALLARGADPNVLNERGQSPLAGAVFKGFEEVVKVLVEVGGASPVLGRPSAREAARMFRRVGLWGLLGVEEGGGGEEVRGEIGGTPAMG